MRGGRNVSRWELGKTRLILSGTSGNCFLGVAPRSDEALPIRAVLEDRFTPVTAIQARKTPLAVRDGGDVEDGMKRMSKEDRRPRKLPG